MFKKKLNELQVPPAATTDPNAQEIARIWGAHKQQHVSLNVGLWNDPGAWGIMLVDLARHVANYYEQEQRVPAEIVMKRIKEVFDAEWETKTAPISGGLMDESMQSKTDD